MKSVFVYNYTIFQKFVAGRIFAKKVHLFDQKILFQFYISSCGGKAEFSAAITHSNSELNHTNTLFWCSRNISYYYHCWKQCLIFCGNQDNFFFLSGIFDE